MLSNTPTSKREMLDPTRRLIAASEGNPVKADPREIIRNYSAEPAVFQHKALLICIHRSASKTSLYEATRYAWKVNRSKAEQAEVILATVQGLIVGAFVADDWLAATSANFPGREDAPGRLGFVGREAPEEIRRLYADKRVPDPYRKLGAANPIKYTWSE